MLSLMLLVQFIGPDAKSEDLSRKAEELFNEGSALIEWNNHDSTDATKSGLERGIELVRRAVELGYPDIRSAYLLLAAANNDLAFSYHGGEGEEFDDIAEHRDDYYRRLLELYPNDAEVLFQNSDLVGGKGFELDLLRRAVEADPNHAESNFYLGIYLMQAGNYEEGIPFARRGIENCGALVFLAHSQRFLDLLRSSGRHKDVQDFEEHYKELEIENLGQP